MEIDELNLNFESSNGSIFCKRLDKFIDCWSRQYKDTRESCYENNIGKPLTESSRYDLFFWKNGGKISDKKVESIEKNYPLSPPSPSALESTYLDEARVSGPIWDIFYLHIVNPEKYPIFDQHVYRAMRHMKSEEKEELPEGARSRKNRKKIFDEYKVYRCFHKKIVETIERDDDRKVDKALWTLGKKLKGRGGRRGC